MKRSRRRRQVLLWSGIALLAIFASACYALLRTPGWYTLPDIPPQQRQAVRNNLLAAEQAFTESLRTPHLPFVYHLYQEDVNRWIAMRREIYPLIDELAPPELVDPIVLFDDGRITVAGRCKKGGLDVLLSIDIDVAFVSDEIVLRLAAVRCGSMRAPISLASVGLDRPMDLPADSLWPGSPRVWGDFKTGLHVDSRGWWKNGGIAYRVLGVSVEPGKLNLSIEPLEHHAPKNRKNQD